MKYFIILLVLIISVFAQDDLLIVNDMEPSDDSIIITIHATTGPLPPTPPTPTPTPRKSGGGGASSGASASAAAAAAANAVSNAQAVEAGPYFNNMPVKKQIEPEITHPIDVPVPIVEQPVNIPIINMQFEYKSFRLYYLAVSGLILLLLIFFLISRHHPVLKESFSGNVDDVLKKAEKLSKEMKERRL